MASRVIWVAGVLVASALALIAILNFLSAFALYHPHPYRTNDRSLRTSGLLELPFTTSAGRQTAFYRPPPNEVGLPARIWVLFCGNGSLALDWWPLVARDRTPGNAFLFVDYPGYGKSEGRPSLASTRLAAAGALAALAAHLGVETKALQPLLNTMGHSLGAAVALDFASQHPQVGRIVLFAPFTSFRAEAATVIGSALSHLLRTNYDNRVALQLLAQRVPAPRVVIFHGLQDRVIPPRMGRDLAAEFPDFVTFRSLPEANHDTVVDEAAEEVLALLADDHWK